MQKDFYSIEDLQTIMQALRTPETGCPWDLKQTFSSIVSHTLEEAYEVADAIERQDFAELKYELGDLLFQVIFYSQLGKEQALFDFPEVVDGICKKLIRRHPHVFADAKLATDAEIKANWEKEKAKERAEKSSNTHNSVLDDVPNNLPALSRANKLQKRCASVGFDWPQINQTIAKVKEEIAELEVEIAAKQQDKAAEELGDLMFALVNVNRQLKIDPETTLRKANQKFEKRFRQVELLAQQVYQQNIDELTLEQMESLWQSVKRHQAL
ncbi:MazG family protein [Catenovulum agarivorans DS-2]|uniref:Nucleoside triphosphate pyrophosphohydrolase n=1 Tax=Catenovulum agarivorans DS-2 TaxID=1328313 RepID=W7QMH9_9ALTE|nr:nucleoside triphosphate pyrophosphohydrolase [Catenovulum agarivorans]EWH10137.1 MazG family protein [Catenovulum agarivorans DS-2]